MDSTTEPKTGDSSVILRYPQLKDQDDFDAARKEFAGTDFDFALGYKPEQGFKAYLDLLANYRRGINLPPGHVKALFLVAEAGGCVVGRISLRLELNATLSQFGGHVGYAVRPQYRGLGYAKFMLEQTLRVAARHRLERILAVCAKTNEPSRAVIKACGGIYEGEIRHDDGLVRERYWLETPCR